MKTARKQTVGGVLCSGLMHHNVKLNKYDAAKLLLLLRKLENENHKINTELASLVALLNDKGIKYVVVKGQTIACRYPYPDTRAPGDIDFYCDSENFERARQVLVEEWNVEFEEEDNESEQHLAFTHNDVIFEMHFCLYKFASKRLQKLFNEKIDGAEPLFVMVAETQVPVLPPSLNIAYTFLHLWHHMVEIGVGLRQFCDLEVLLVELADSGNQDEVRKLCEFLDELKFTKAFQAVEYVLVDKMGLSSDKLPIPLAKNSKRYEKDILDIVFTRGNFGKYGRKTEIRSGWKYYLESMFIKMSHYSRFFSLSPRENLAVLSKSIPSRIFMAMKREKK
ncbi:MAG: nucleotidyltransferase family protein [Prevotella sp.]